MIGVYKITNTINGKIYVGQSRNINERWKRHKKDIYKLDYPLYLAIRKYGLENFSFEVIELCLIEELSVKELYFIKLYDSIVPNGYNVSLSTQNFNSILSFNDLQLIKKDIKENILSMKEISEKWELSVQTLSSINSGRSWVDDKEQYPLRNTTSLKNKKCSKCGAIISGKGKSNLCTVCCGIQQRHFEVNRNELKKQIRTMPFTHIAKEYGVSDNAIKKRCKLLNLPYRKKDINQYSDEEWEKI